jgi:hypothetical protein
MHVLEFIIEWLSIPLEAWILVLLVRKSLYRRFPWFFSYMVYATVTDVARTVLIGRAVYFYVYWGTAAIAYLVAVFAIYESFRAIFRVFYRLAWFRFVWPGAITVIWIYCIWRAWVHPPPHFGRSGAILISGVIASSFTIVGLVLLFFLLVKVVIKRWYLFGWHGRSGTHSFRIRNKTHLADRMGAFSGIFGGPFGVGISVLASGTAD